ncbi:prepilin peptidase [Paenibacillus sp. FSL R10-2791]|uniref:prepilin peptidase n=1 Tax=Paenibacillus sp. FSL R10-2791 TaxID=2954695 RepID=UPI0030F53C92
MSSISLHVWLLFPLMLWASICDLKTKQIPNVIPFAIFFVGLLHFSPFFSIAGLLCTGLPYWIGAIGSDGKIGGGDIKLMAACGFVIGPLHGTLQSLFGLGFVLLFALTIAFRHGFHIAKNTALPLAPFLSAGGVAVVLLTYLAQ